MRVENLRAPRDTVGDIFYFGRMLDKIRLHQADKLPEDYHEFLGDGFDRYCSQFLKVDYAALTERVKQGGSDEELLEWCFEQGHQPSEVEIQVFNEFLSKRGWRDSSSEILTKVKKRWGLEDDSILTFFDLIEKDEEWA